MQVSIEAKNRETVASVVGSINSANAAEFGEALASLPVGDESVTLDVEGLEYISSAGLRVILSLKKRCGKNPFRVINANTEVMEVFDMTGFSEIMEIEPAAKSVLTAVR